MNISYESGPNLIEAFNADKLAAEAAKPEFVSAIVYIPGKTVHIAGTDYKVGRAGNLIKVR
jgi:hypothetical protein